MHNVQRGGRLTCFCSLSASLEISSDATPNGRPACGCKGDPGGSAGAKVLRAAVRADASGLRSVSSLWGDQMSLKHFWMACTWEKKSPLQP